MNGLRVVLAAAALWLAALDDVNAQTVIRHTTQAGLTFRYVHIPQEQSQALYFAWKDGSAVALPGKEALPSLATALIMEGPRGSSRSAMIEDLRDLHATIALSATVNVTQGHIVAPAEKFSETARMLARTLADPALPADALADMIKSRATSSRQTEANAETMAQRLLARLVIGRGPYRNYAVGEAASFERVTLADIERWRKNVLVRDGLVLVAAGPLPPSELARDVDAVFATLPLAGDLAPPAKPVLRAPGKLVVLERPVVQTAIAAGGPMQVHITPDFARGQLAIVALGGASSSRLWLAVREKLGATYGISAAIQPVDFDNRTLLIRTAIANDKAKDAVAAIREEYARLLADGLRDEEIEPLKTIFIRNHRERMRRASNVAANLLVPAVREFPDDFLATYEQRLRSYTRGAIEADMRAQFPEPPLTMVLVAPSAEGLGADCVIKSSVEIARCD